MNCEKCQELISDLLDGSINNQDKALLSSHLDECLGCRDVRTDLEAIVSFCHSHRGEYEAPLNEHALWLRIRNVVEVGSQVTAPAPAKSSKVAGWFGRTWELSLPQLAASVAAIVLVVSLSTVVGLKRWQTGNVTQQTVSSGALSAAAENILERTRQQQQMIEYWNQRVEMNKARWSPQMRETFDRNLKVIDQAVNVSMAELSKNPHDEVSEEMLNAALNEKLSILKEFADL
jgi:predicted anti-sigma-YlaC factor YlaD